MSQEIYYTSAPEGLKRGSSGFCTVAATDNIPRALWDRLETLSAYRHVTGAGAQGAANPVSHAHWALAVAGRTHHVVSRICDSGVDHTQRTNAFAHHIVLDAAEMQAATGGPAWLLQQPGVMATQWDGRVGPLPAGGRPPGGDTPPRICSAWAAAAGDAGWGGLLADIFAKTPARPVCILFAPGQELLPLLAESIALLPPAARWNVTFNTYFTSMPTSATCVWRCCLVDTPAADVGMRYAANGLILNLADLSRMPALAEGPYVKMARSGIAVEVPRAPAKSAPLKPAEAAPKNVPPATLQEEMALDEGVLDFTEPPRPEPGPALEPATAGAASTAKARPSRLPLRPIRRADEALEEAERQADAAAQRRRRQVVLMFGGALAALAAGTGLIIFLGHSSAPPPELPRIVSSKPAVAVEVPLSVPDVPQVTPIPTQPQVTVQSHPAVPPPTEPSAPPAVVYPDVVATLTGLDPPSLGTGIGDREQLLLVRAADIDPALVRGLRMLLPGKEKSTEETAVYPVEDAGALTARPESRGGRPGIVLLWKPSNETGSPTEIGFIAWDATRPALNFQWHAAPLLRDPSLFNLVYWLLQAGSLELDSTADHKQRLAMKPFTPPDIDFSKDHPSIAWPVDLPREAVATPGGDLPAGWQADHTFDWAGKDPAAQTPENALQVIKFKKATNVSIADAIFTVTFKPGLGKMDCTFSSELEDHQKDLERFESELRAIDQHPEDVALQQKRAETVTLVEAYKSAIAGYNELSKFDLFFEMPDGVRLAAVHFQRKAGP